VIKRLLYNLTAKLPCRLIGLDSGPYLERYYLGKVLGITFYLHRFVSSDSERHVHNHPWGWAATVILCGSYLEERVIDLCPSASESGCLTEYRTRRWFGRVNGNTFHQIHEAERNTWTLFFHGPRVPGKGWGFFERMQAGDDVDVTVFIPHKARPTQWWLTAPWGRNAGREAL